MRVYRISLAIYSRTLLASGNPARWNSKEVKMIYTAQSRALACLENIVHRDSKGLQKSFRIMEIDIPDKLKIERILETDLIADWKNFYNIPYTQQIGDDWITSLKTPVLQVPSVIVTGDFNYLINPSHKDFSSIKLLSAVPFEFDSRIKKEQ